MSRSLGLVLGLIVAAVSGFGCFDIDDPPPTPEDPTGVIAGTITVTTNGGQPFSTGFAQRAGAHEERRVLGATDLPVEKEFKPGEAIVLFERNAFNRASIVPTLQRMKKAAGFDDVTITLKGCVFRQVCTVTLIDDKGFLDEERTSAFVAAMTKHRAPGIRLVMENIRHHGFVTPNDPLYPLQWGMEQMRLPAAWDLTTGDSDVVVAVVDSGVKHANTDLRDRLARDPNNFNRFVEFDFVTGADLELDDVAGIDLDAEDPGDNLNGTDEGEDSYHGTHVAGIIGAETNNGFGVCGVMWSGQILPVRVLGSQLSGNLDDIFNGLAWAIGDTDPEFDIGQVVNQRPARVVNLSLGAPDTDGNATTVWTSVVDEIIDDPDGFVPNDVTLVVAAGNAAQDARGTTPANVPRVITVGASRFDGVRADYSNFGTPIDILAPGGQQSEDRNNDGNDDGIVSTWNTDVKSEQGTSMAAPHVTGLVGLILSARPDLKHDQIHGILHDSANRNFRCNEGCGDGLVDAAQALILAGAQLEPAPRLSADNSRLAFPGGIGRLTMHVLNLGNVVAPFTLSIVGDDAALFSLDVSDGELAAGGEQAVTVTLARDGATEGDATLRITGTGAAAGQSLDVALLFDDGVVPSRREVDAVLVQAMVRTADGLEVKGEALAERNNGFTYEITGLAAGSYEVYAIGDDNHDSRFDAQFESQGGYPNLDAVTAVAVETSSSRVADIDFEITLSEELALEGGVGAACSTVADCSGIDFAPNAECLGLDGGYCSRECTEDRFCGATGVCRTFLCDNGNGPVDCDLCAQRCVADSQCRDGYLCLFGACEPEGFAN